MTSTKEDGLHLPPISVLLVEDEPIIAVSVKRTLLRLGCAEVNTADSGAQAMELAERSRPDVVIMDIGLRGEMDGAEAAAIIRRRFGVPIVFASAHQDRSVVQNAESATPAAWLLKPFTATDLQSSIQAALESPTPPP